MMDDTILEESEAEEIPVDEPKLAESETAAERRSLKDRYSGEKIRDIADKAGLIGGISSVVVGFLIWSRTDDFAGFLVGLVVVGIGIFASYVLASVLYSYGDIVANSFEQTKILKRLEEQRALEALKPVQDDVRPEENDQREDDKNKLVAEVEAIQAEKAAALAAAAEAAAEKQPEAELSTPESRRLALAKKLKLPLHGVIDARMRRVAHFTERSRYGVICPVCGRKQDSERNNCFFCDCKFVYDDETIEGADDDLLDRLRRLQAK